MRPLAARPSLTPINPARAAEVRAAAIGLFAERGYRGTTVNDIADALGIRGPSLYKHVRSKQQLLQEIVLSTMDQLLEEQRTAIESSDDPVVQLHEMIRGAVARHVADPALAHVCNRELTSLEEPAWTHAMEQRDLYWRRLRDVVDRGAREGSFAVASSAATAFSIVELAAGTASWFDERHRLTQADVAEQVAEMALRLAGAARLGRVGADAQA